MIEVLPSTSNAASSNVKLEGAARQMTLHQTSAKTQKFSSGSPQATKITMAVADFVAKDLHPIATVEGEAFAVRDGTTLPCAVTKACDGSAKGKV